MDRKFRNGFLAGIFSTLLFGAICFWGFLKLGEKLVEKRLRPPSLPDQLKESYEFRYTTLNGETRYISSLKGKVAFVNFWGTWCIPCVVEMPTIQKLYDRYKNDTSVVFVIASRLDDADKIRSFAGKHSYTLPFYTIRDKDIPASMNFNQYPVTFIYAKDGSIAMKHVNATDWSDSTVVAFIDKLKQQ